MEIANVVFDALTEATPSDTKLEVVISRIVPIDNGIQVELEIRGETPTEAYIVQDMLMTAVQSGSFTTTVKRDVETTTSAEVDSVGLQFFFENGELEYTSMGTIDELGDTDVQFDGLMSRKMSEDCISCSVSISKVINTQFHFIQVYLDWTHPTVIIPLVITGFVILLLIACIIRYKRMSDSLDLDEYGHDDGILGSRARYGFSFSNFNGYDYKQRKASRLNVQDRKDPMEKYMYL